MAPIWRQLPSCVHGSKLLSVPCLKTPHDPSHSTSLATQRNIMTDHRAELAAAIRHNRPKISASSITTYVSCLANLAKKMDGSPTKAWFEGHDEAILKFLADKPARSRKTTLSALFVLTDYDRFRQQMLADCKTVADDYKKQERDPREVAA